VQSNSPMFRPPAGRRAMARRRTVRRRWAFVGVLTVVILVAAVAVSGGVPFLGGGSDAADDPTAGASGGGASGDGDGSGNGAGSEPAVIAPGKTPIKHVVFLIKENRTFDNYFGTYGHGSEGAAEGKTAHCKGSPKDCTGFGETVPLKPGYDMQPHDITHGFASGLYAINGGRMNGYNIIGEGSDLTGYTTLDDTCEISPAADEDAVKQGSG